MIYKLCFGAGFATGYYFGSKAGRQRYDEINRALGKLRQSPKVEAVADKAKHVLDEGVDKAKHVLDEGVDKAKHVLDEGVEKAKTVVGEGVDKAKGVVTRKANGSSSPADGSPNGTNTVPAAAPATGA
jgi:hypothetical protein